MEKAAGIDIGADLLEIADVPFSYRGVRCTMAIADYCERREKDNVKKFAMNEKDAAKEAKAKCRKLEKKAAEQWRNFTYYCDPDKNSLEKAWWPTPKMQSEKRRTINYLADK